MTPAEKFANNPFYREEIAKFLANDAFRDALAILKEELEPVATDKEAMLDPVLAAAERHRIAGATHIIKGLKRLATEPVKAKKLPGIKPLLTEEQFKQQQKKP